MKIYLIVHGFVQGVGYRYFVKRTAQKHGIRGMVRNMADGSVAILAEADSRVLADFEKEINVRITNGPDVSAIERFEEHDPIFPKEIKDYDRFVIVHSD
jgi:acylphosphatase